MSPTFELAAEALVRISMSAPLKPMSTPRAFLPVTGSLSMSAESTMANIGAEVVTMLALMGEVMLRPMM